MTSRMIYLGGKGNASVRFVRNRFLHLADTVDLDSTSGEAVIEVDGKRLEITIKEAEWLRERLNEGFELLNSKGA